MHEAHEEGKCRSEIPTKVVFASDLAISDNGKVFWVSHQDVEGDYWIRFDSKLIRIEPLADGKIELGFQNGVTVSGTATGIILEPTEL